MQTTVQLFIKSSQHSAVVKSKNEDTNGLTEYAVIIALEDVFKEILKKQLIDEYDIDFNMYVYHLY